MQGCTIALISAGEEMRYCTSALLLALLFADYGRLLNSILYYRGNCSCVLREKLSVELGPYTSIVLCVSAKESPEVLKK